MKVVFATFIALLTATSHAGVYYDRLRQDEAQYRVQEIERNAQAQVNQQLKLKEQIQALANKHNGQKDAGECGRMSPDDCRFFAICMPIHNEKVSVAELGTTSVRVEQCEVTFGDESVCTITNDPEFMWSRRKGNRVPKLKADCIDANRTPHHIYQY